MSDQGLREKNGSKCRNQNIPVSHPVVYIHREFGNAG